MTRKKKIADSVWLNRSVEALLAGWLRFCFATSRWERVGFDPLYRVQEAGEPVIAVLWHQRLLMAPFLFDVKRGPICTITSTGRAGQLAGRAVARFGLDTIAMKSHDSNVALSRQVLGRVRQGTSVGLTADGPRGPARIAAMAPVAWARSSGCRVFVVAWSARRVWQLKTWDRMWIPKPFTRGVLMCAEWDVQVPRKATADEMETHRLGLQEALQQVTAAADAHIGRTDADPGA